MGSGAGLYRPLFGTGKKMRGGDKGGGTACTGSTRKYKPSDQGGSWGRVVIMLWNLDCPVGLMMEGRNCFI